MGANPGPCPSMGSGTKLSTTGAHPKRLAWHASIMLTSLGEENPGKTLNPKPSTRSVLGSALWMWFRLCIGNFSDLGTPIYTRNIAILIVGTPNKVPLFLGNPKIPLSL